MQVDYAAYLGLLQRARDGGQAGLNSPHVVLACLEQPALPANWGESDVVAEVAQVIGASGLSVSVSSVSSVADASSFREGNTLVFPNGRLILRGPGAPILLAQVLDQWRVPYLGSSPKGLAVESKAQLKFHLRSRGISTPDYWVLDEDASRQSMTDLTFPAVVKPDRGCESIGVSRVDNSMALSQALDQLREKYGFPILVEKWSRHREYTVAIVGNGGDRRGFAMEVIVPDRYEFLTEDAKLHALSGTLHMVGTSDERRTVVKLAVAASHAVGVRDWARVDLLEDGDGELYVIDINTLPGLRRNPEHPSYFPACVHHNTGLDYADTIRMVLCAALLRNRLNVPDPMRRVHAEVLSF